MSGSMETDFYARWSYDSLLLEQPHVRFDGLWELDGWFYISCPDANNARATDGKNLVDWFNHSCCVAGSPTKIVTSVPPSATRVPERTIQERINLVGSPRRIRDLLIDLSLLVPHEFPPFDVDGLNPGAALVTNRALTSEERQQVDTAFERLGETFLLEFRVDPLRNIAERKIRFTVGSGDIDLLPARCLPSKCGRSLKFLVEEDDDTWSAQKERLFSGEPPTVVELLPDGWHAQNGLSCLVQPSLPGATGNLRSYLSLYQTAVFVMPLDETLEGFCRELNVTATELQQLLEVGRVKLLLPQAIDRYDVRWLNDAAERAPQSMMLSRRLAAATVADARRRIPLLYPAASPWERYELAHILIQNAAKLVGPDASAGFITFIQELCSGWGMSEHAVHARGAMGTSHLGAGLIAANIYEQVTGRDLRLELWSAAQRVEWAATIGAHAFPMSGAAYDDTPACDMVASIYGPAVSPTVAATSSLQVVRDILALDNNAPIVAFAKEFASPDITRLREVVTEIATKNIDPEHLARAIEKFNAEVRHYERRADGFKSLNIVGWIGAGVAATGLVDPSVQRYVPLATMALKLVVDRLIDSLPRRSLGGGKAVDLLNSMLALQANPAAVMVARAKKEAARLKK